jgi:hypothetical protein
LLSLSGESVREERHAESKKNGNPENSSDNLWILGDSYQESDLQANAEQHNKCPDCYRPKGRFDFRHTPPFKSKKGYYTITSSNYYCD